MDNQAYNNDPYDKIGDDKEHVRNNSADYQTLNISPDENSTVEPTAGPGEVTFLDTKVPIEDDGLKRRPPTGRKPREIPLKPYAGMNKEDLLRFSNTPFWNRMRMGCLAVFWLCWLGLLAAVIALTIVLPRCTAPPTLEKWQTSVYYQIYVRSFSDSDGDGVGDINGITARLDYLEENHIDAIVLSSIYRSHDIAPQDFGYDVVDHTEISSDYGTLDDFRRLLEQAHERDISVLLDFIPGQTGTQHPWFISSAASTGINDQYRNYYIWANGTGTNPPNNWLNLYTGSAWHFNTTRPQYFLGQFLSHQPQLNLRSALVREELENILRYWLDLGVDGFKIVNAPYLYADYDLRNEQLLPGCTDPDSYDCYDHIYTKNQEESYNVIASWRHVLDEYSTRTERARVLLTDTNDSINDTVKYFGQFGARAANLPMNYLLREVQSDFDEDCLEDRINEWLRAVPYGETSNWATTNQDMARNASYLTPNIVNMLTFTLPGSPIFYYGDELGLGNGVNPGTPVDPVGGLKPELSRDPYRTPMPWNNETDGGFVNQTGNSPWLPVYSNYEEISVMAQKMQRRSTLDNFMNLAYLRRAQGALQFGDFQFGVVDAGLISFIRSYDGFDNIMIVANIGQSETSIDLTVTSGVPRSATLLFASDVNEEAVTDDNVDLRSLSITPGNGLIVSWPFSRPTS